MGENLCFSFDTERRVMHIKIVGYIQNEIEFVIFIFLFISPISNREEKESYIVIKIKSRDLILINDNYEIRKKHTIKVL